MATNPTKAAERVLNELASLGRVCGQLTGQPDTMNTQSYILWEEGFIAAGLRLHAAFTAFVTDVPEAARANELQVYSRGSLVNPATLATELTEDGDALTAAARLIVEPALGDVIQARASGAATYPRGTIDVSSIKTLAAAIAAKLPA